ncbi:MAG TPA: hypothetical protein VFE46_07360 [Pirellulales bacterium]|jgi:hypothetical protein|nr:hypothetical protein [Pirellulales bacterium]
MTKAVLPMDSYRLAQYAVQVSCYICGQGNAFDAELCRHCQAPMALAHQAQSQKLQPQMVATIGSSGVGKTVYLGMLLDMLSRMPDEMQIVARGAFSVTLQQNAMQALARCEFPAKTSNEPDRWNWVHCQVRRPQEKHPFELIMPDVAGEALLEEVEHPHSYVAIRSFLQKCAGAMILVDSTGLLSGHNEQNYFTMKLLTYLSELETDEKNSWQQRPVALVFSKADQCEDSFDDPTIYAQRHAASLWQYCRERFHQHKFFAAGVAGATGMRNVPSAGRVRAPLRIEPRGILEPFRWIVEQIRSKRERSKR